MKPYLGVFIGFLMAVDVVCGVASPVPSVRIILPGDAGPLAKQAGNILGRQIAERCGAEVATGGKAALSVELGIDAGIGTEGFKIADGPGNTVRILGNDGRGLLYGVGKFLRSSRYDRGGFTPGAWRGTSVPKCPIRGIYLATHFNNYYEAASPEELERYVEDLSLWGFNLLALTFPHWQYSGYSDPAVRRMGDHLRRIMRVAKQVGMRVGIGDALERWLRIYSQGNALHARTGSAGEARTLRCEPLPEQGGGKRTAAEELGTVDGRVCRPRPGFRYVLALRRRRLRLPRLLAVGRTGISESVCARCRCWCARNLRTPRSSSRRGPSTRLPPANGRL